MNWMELFLFLVTAVTFWVFGAICMAVMSSSSNYEEKTEAFNLGYEIGVKEEKERIGNLLDKYIENLGKECANNDARTNQRDC